MLALILCSILSATITGRVVSVHDGDTLTVLEGTTQIKVRLSEIDAPELKQRYGRRATLAIVVRLLGRQVAIEPAGKDRYGRTLGTVYLGEENVNLWMVKEGWAWRYDRYSKSDILKRAQEEAKKERKGLWRDERAVEPGEWRKAKSKHPTSPLTPEFHP